MLERALEDAALAVMAVAVVALAQVVDVQRRVDAAREAHAGVYHEAHDHADDDLRAEDLEDHDRRHLLGDEDGQHLVGRGQEHREQRAQRDDAPGPERGRHGREAALRHHAHHRAHDGPRSSRALHGRLRLAAGLVLEPLHGQVGDEQKRDEVQGVGQRMLQHVFGYVRDGFHGSKILTRLWRYPPNRCPPPRSAGPPPSDLWAKASSPEWPRRRPRPRSCRQRRSARAPGR